MKKNFRRNLWKEKIGTMHYVCEHTCELLIAFGDLRTRVKLKGRITEDRKQLHPINSRLHQKKYIGKEKWRKRKIK